jgi:phosphoserine aminotransferase
LLYKEIDDSPLFKGKVVVEDRSKMNVCFVMNDTSLEKDFITFTQEHGIYGIKGHRTSGGFRASLYNALPIQSVQYLVELMQNFALQRS